MNTRREVGKREQMQERVRNALIAINGYRATRLEDARLESILTQLEHVQTALEESTYFSFSEIRGFDFHITEGTPLEGNEPLTRELYSIRNYVENAL
jgi:hypothetical protein